MCVVGEERLLLLLLFNPPPKKRKNAQSRFLDFCGDVKGRFPTGVTASPLEWSWEETPMAS